MLPSSSLPVADGHVVRVGLRAGRAPHRREHPVRPERSRTAAAPCADTALPAASATAGSSVCADGASAIRWLKSASAS